MPTKLGFTEDKYLRAKELCERYSISNVTLHRWISTGKIPKPQYLNLQRVWLQSAIDAAEQHMLNSGERQVNHLVRGAA